MKVILLAALMLTAGVALVPEATAACQPLLDPDFCVGGIEPEGEPLVCLDRVVFLCLA